MRKRNREIRAHADRAVVQGENRASRPERACGQVQKIDLIEDTEPQIRIFDLLKRQIRFLQQRPWIDALRFCMCVSEIA